MGLKNLAGLSLAKCNGTYALPPQKPKTKKAAARNNQRPERQLLHLQLSKQQLQQRAVWELQKAASLGL